MFRYSAHRLSQTRRAESLRWYFAPCNAGPIRSRGFSSSDAVTGFTPTAPSPSVSSPFTAPIPTPTLRHSSPFRLPCSHVRSALPFHLDSTICARAGKTAISRLVCHTVRRLPRLSACLLTLWKTERTMLTHRPSRLLLSRAEEYLHALISMHSGAASHAGSDGNEYIHIKICPSFSVYRQSKVSQGYRLHFFSLCSRVFILEPCCSML